MFIICCGCFGWRAGLATLLAQNSWARMVGARRAPPSLTQALSQLPPALALPTSQASAIILTLPMGRSRLRAHAFWQRHVSPPLFTTALCALRNPPPPVTARAPSAALGPAAPAPPRAAPVGIPRRARRAASPGRPPARLRLPKEITHPAGPGDQPAPRRWRPPHAPGTRNRPLHIRNGIMGPHQAARPTSGAAGRPMGNRQY